MGPMKIPAVDGARKDLEKAVEANPDYLPGLLNLALCLEKLGDSDGALRRLNAILERRPGLPVAVYSRGVLQFKAGRWKDALPDLERAVLLSPAPYRAQTRDLIEDCRRRLGLPPR
jgi:tetratricopeptide (TPR) repeat protein